MQTFRIPDLTREQLERIRQDARRPNDPLARYDAAFASSFPVAASLAASSSGGGWHPSMVPQVAAGYWWDISAASGLGTTGFKIPEAGLHTTFDVIQATILSQPTALAENGVAQFRCRKQADTNPTILRSSGDVQAGWTGATYQAGWWRLPDASGDVTGTGTFLGHRKGGAARMNYGLNTSGGVDRLSGSVSVDGTTVVTNIWAAPLTGYHWCELIFDPALTLGGSVSADKLKLFYDFAAPVLLTGVTIPDTINNTSAPIVVCFSAVTSLSNADTTDFGGVIVYANGIPSLANRVMLSRWNAPRTL